MAARALKQRTGASACRLSSRVELISPTQYFVGGRAGYEGIMIMSTGTSCLEGTCTQVNAPLVPLMTLTDTARGF
jgi:hypothetical protein